MTALVGLLHRSTLLCINFVKFGRRQIGDIVRYLLGNKNICFTLKLLLLSPKICQRMPPVMHSKCSRFHPNRFTYDGVVAERVNTAKSRLKVNPIFNVNYSDSRCLLCKDASFDDLRCVGPHCLFDDCRRHQVLQ